MNSAKTHTQKQTLHQFSSVVAKLVGVPAAAVYQYILWWCRHHGQYTGSYDDLLKVFPYLSRKQLRRIMRKLIDQSDQMPLLVRKWMRGRNEYVILVANPKMELHKLHGFDVEFALRHNGNVNMAVIYDDILRWIVTNDNDDQPPSHFESPAQWYKTHGYIPRRTVERCFAKLVQFGEIRLAGKLGRHNTPIWQIPLHEGRLERWKELHRYNQKKKVNKSKRKIIYVPVLADDDFTDQKSH